MWETGHNLAVKSVLRDGWQSKFPADRGVFDLTSGRSTTTFGSIRVNVGDRGMFTEVNASSSSVINVSVARGNISCSWMLSVYQGWFLGGCDTGGE